jgi:SAM-dependent methyltransferase
MDVSELRALDRVDLEHWFYRGKRDIVRYWLSLLLRHGPDDLLVDVGVGTGQFLLEMSGLWPRHVGCDSSATSLLLASRCVSRLVRGSLEDIPLRTGIATAVTALDVLEHLDDDRRGLAELVRITRPAGVILVNVPAFPLLWSDWDVSLGHRRRYVRRTLLDLVDPAESTILHCAYANPFLFLPILLIRRLRSHLKRSTGQRMEDRLPRPLLNRMLHRLFVGPACLRWFRPPFGTSLLMVLQRRPAERPVTAR